MRVLLILLLAMVASVLQASDSTLPETALVDAIEKKSWSAIDWLTQSKAHIHASQSDGMTALHWAVVHGEEKIVDSLLVAGADPNARTRYEVTPLTIACRQGHTTIAKQLLEAKGNANTKLPGGETLLMTASRSGNEDLVQTLLDAGANVDATERRGQTALMWAAAAGHATIVQKLLDAGADRDRTLNSGFNALRFAARQGNLAAVETLVAAGADVLETMQDVKGGERRPRNGMNALMLAVESAHYELALRLVELGADPNDQRSGFTPLHAITWVRRANLGDNPAGDPPPRGSGNVTSLEFVRRLAEVGADVNARLKRGQRGTAKLTHEGATPFLMAAKTADLPLMKVLYELGADPQVTNVDGTTPLITAAGVGVTAVGEEPGTEAEVIAALDWLLGGGNGHQRQRQERRNRHARRCVSQLSWCC